MGAVGFVPDYQMTYYPQMAAYGGMGASIRPETVPAKEVGAVGGVSADIGGQGVEKSKPTECQTCKERRYVDDSTQGNVSFQVPTHLNPNEAGAHVMAHEREHVRNAVNEGKQDNKQLVSVSVSLKMGICPECGRSYVAGGVTRTKMTTYRPNPYDQARKSVEGTVLRGMNVNRGL